jgi:hypothetical protein
MIQMTASISPDSTEVQLVLSVEDGGNEPFDVTINSDALLEFIESLIQIREQMKPSIADAEKAKAN